MAVTTRTTIVCDVCRNPKRKTVVWRLQKGDVASLVVLCREDAKPLEELMLAGVEDEHLTSKAKLWTMEEIDALKS